MSRPLIVSDCDEVLLYMVAPFRDWLAEQHGVTFDMSGGDFGRSIKYAHSGEPVDPEEIWRLLNLFFDGEMHRQSPVSAPSPCWRRTSTALTGPATPMRGSTTGPAPCPG
jgi:hypothetical protein